MKVFVSHAIADQSVALPFVTLLTDGIGIPATDVFCSSTKGNIPNGQFFVQHILKQLHVADHVISLLSRHYLRSEFCIAELGIAVVRQFQEEATFSSYLIPPTRFSDMGGMLNGVQSEYLEDQAYLDGLCVRLGGNPTSPMWQVARNVFQAALKPVSDLRKAEEMLSQVVVHDFLPDPALTADKKYKMKIRVMLKNNTREAIHVGNAGWAADSSDVPRQTPPHRWNVWQVEGERGWHNNDWQGDNIGYDELDVPAGAVFRLWVGLHQAFSPDDLRRRHESQQLGLLSFDVTFKCVTLKWNKHL